MQVLFALIDDGIIDIFQCGTHAHGIARSFGVDWHIPVRVVISEYLVVIQLVVDGYGHLECLFETGWLHLESDVVFNVDCNSQPFLWFRRTHEHTRCFVWHWTHGGFKPFLGFELVFILIECFLTEPKAKAELFHDLLSLLVFLVWCRTKEWLVV